ncbi:glutamate-rich protein 6 isoform X3 [Silurus meridionalis]|uniref:glutamate-rich protein 6 isoform X3 n=1 Tax=Silurus meridionalis TaxID=175797 RepID=UPI001EEAFE57|nr:glutamate-rich protein 6 isoform X3 [Silurus meridionalis]
MAHAEEDGSDNNMTEMEIEEEALPEPQYGFHGVLRYRRESEWRQIGLQPTSASDHTVCCEFCGSKAKLPFDFSKTPDPLDFCCAPYMEMFKKVEQQWHSLQESSRDYDYNMDKAQEFRDRAILQDVLQQVAEESKKAKRPTSGTTGTETPGCKVTSSGLFTTIVFRLSDFLRTKVKEDRPDKEEPRATSKPCSTSSSFPAGFGLCHHKGNIQKFYSSGSPFLTAISDGTTQVFYPSGNLAIMTFVDDTEGVCIVLDDVQPSCPIRAFFQSSGIAICYHSNGSTWLHMDPWGAQSLSEDGSKCKKWKWMDHAKKQIPFKPVYLSLNKHVGVQVRGQKFVLVTFLASGQQARFKVGSCTKPNDTAPPLCEEDLMLRVSQLNARLALERLRWCIDAQTDAKRWPLNLPPNLVSEGRRLLKLTSNVWLEEKHKAYVQNCLRDCQ